MSDDFASLFGAAAAQPTKRHKPGTVLQGTVLVISGDSVFLDVGGSTDARIPRIELMDQQGNTLVKVGDKVRATVRRETGDSLELAVGLGRGGAELDTAALSLAREAGTPVEGKVVKVVKAGLEVELGGVRAFCPASQVDLTYQADLTPFEGRTLEFKVLEIREGGRSIVVSRRALLEAQRGEREAVALERLVPGAELDAVVASTTKHGAIVDLGGVEGFLHVSELAHGRVERVEDVVAVGETVRVQVLAIEQTPRGLKVRVSRRALQSPGAATAAPAPAKDEILEGKVSRITTFGVFVETAQGEGLVPIKELGLHPGADHRRAFPQGTPVKVVLVSRDATRGKLRFSIAAVANVEERNNYRDFSARGADGGATGLGNLGDVLRRKLGLPEPPPEPSAAAAPAPPMAAAPGRAVTPAALVPPPGPPAPAPATMAALVEPGVAREGGSGAGPAPRAARPDPSWLRRR